MMKTMKQTIFLFIFLAGQVFAQSSMDQEQFDKQVEEIMKARAEMLDSLMNDSGDLEKRMLEMMKRLSNRDQGMGLGLGLDAFDSPVVGQYDWLETDTHRILKLQIKQIKDHPLDIKIEQGMIKIKGDLETTSGTGKNKSVSKTSFSRNFSIPTDVDQTNPEFENSADGMLIKFKKTSLSASKVVTPSVKKESIKAPKKEPERLPINPDQDDLNI